MKYEICKTCHGTGMIRDVSTNTQGHELVTCFDCGGFKQKLVKEKEKDQEVLSPDDPRAMQDDAYEAKRLGTVIFLIGASLIGLKLGVGLFGIAPEMTSLPPWYYVTVIAVVAALAFFFHAIVATLAWVAVFGALLYWGGGFILEHFF